MRRRIKRFLDKALRQYYSFRAERRKVSSHSLLSRSDLGGGLLLSEIAVEETKRIFESGRDSGFHRYGTTWWTNPSCPLAYKYLSLDAMYPAEYFADDIGHPTHDQSRVLYDYMQHVYHHVFARRFESVLELGTGGGEITRHFLEEGLDFLAVEGTTSGVSKLLALGVPSERVLKANLKFLQPINRRFDIAMCTEVAEHIEPWFASKVVQNCIEHADVVWFSAARGNVRPHYHHSNEAPIEAWDNLFAHFGFKYSCPLNGTMGRADRLYMNEASYTRVRPLHSPILGG